MKKNNPVEVIKELVQYLPERDRKVADKLISKRDFEGLKDLVISVDYLMDKHKENEKSIYYNLDVDKITDLYATVQEYCLLLGIDDESDDFIDDEYNDYDEEVNF